jgi:3-hydroxyisobutyrate dehydrogenase-like beta-hydroxyacid dehydrogenase
MKLVLEEAMTKVAVVGLGEAGRLYAKGFADNGIAVSGYDPFTTFEHPGVTQFSSLEEAVRDADIVISLVGATASSSVTQEFAPYLAEGTVVADLNTGSPALKQELAATVQQQGALFADVAVLAPVPRAGHLTPLMVSGEGSEKLTAFLTPLEVPVDNIGGGAGDAASRKLIRSVFMKGLAVTIIESVNAAKVAGCEDWIMGQIIGELGEGSGPFVERLISGSKTHAARRIHEVADASAYLTEIEQPSWVSQAAEHWLKRLLSEQQAEQQS